MHFVRDFGFPFTFDNPTSVNKERTLTTFMKKQIYAVREVNILTSDEEAKMNYLQCVLLNKTTQSF